MSQVKHVAAHIKCNESVFEQLKAAAVKSGEWPHVNGYEVRLDSNIPDGVFELVEEHTVKPFRYMRLGSQFWWGKTLYVNPHDERLQ